jgi:16S rRNA (guanine527-N7)-methyltransferase
VLGVARPDLHLVLVDSRAKRGQFLDDAARRLGLDAEAVTGRAELVGRSGHRGSADAVVARSFGPPAATAECAAPLLRVGGRLVVSEPPPPPQPERWPVRELRRLGLVPGERIGATRAVQVLEQVERCPEAFPRREGMPTKQPLF